MRAPALRCCVDSARCCVRALRRCFRNRDPRLRALALCDVPGAGIATVVRELSRAARLAGFVPWRLPTATIGFEVSSPAGRSSPLPMPGISKTAGASS